MAVFTPDSVVNTAYHDSMNKIEASDVSSGPGGFNPPDTLAVLLSGGLDSAILLGEEAARRPVLPIYVRSGLEWEEVELAHCREFLCRCHSGNILPLVVLDQPTRDLYGAHWSTGAGSVPDERSADDAVYLPGRNLLLLCKAMLYCHLNSVAEIALAPLAGNPFPDASPGFFQSMAALVNQAVGGRLKVLLPYRHLHKPEVLVRGKAMPLAWTFSCIQPIEGKHCGRCNKCHERQEAFARVGMADPTPYAQAPKEIPCTA
jgi:7-cyano-7-deazaguanine synthase